MRPETFQNLATVLSKHKFIVVYDGQLDASTIFPNQLALESHEFYYSLFSTATIETKLQPVIESAKFKKVTHIFLVEPEIFKSSPSLHLIFGYPCE